MKNRKYYNSVIAANNVAIINILKANYTLSESKYFSRELQMKSYTLIVMINKYQLELTDDCINRSNGYSMCDFLVAHYDRIKEDIELLRLKIAEHLRNQEDPFLKADIFLAYTLTNYATELFKSFKGDSQHFTPDYANFNDIRKKLLELVDIFDPNHEIDLDYTYKKAVHKIKEKIIGTYGF